MTEIQSLLLMKATLESANLHGVEAMLDDDCEYVSTGRGIIARKVRSGRCPSLRQLPLSFRRPPGLFCGNTLETCTSIILPFLTHCQKPFFISMLS